jgi:hypothetical protein
LHLEAHAGLGWTIGALLPSGDRRLRNWCLAAAVLPDADAVSFLFGPVAYGRWHHTFGHNVFLGLACVALAASHHRRRGARRAALAGALVAVCFASHLLADAKLSAYTVKPFWPVSSAEYEFTPNLALAAPINTYLVYASFATALGLALWRKRTPLDVVSPRLDRMVVQAFRRRDLACRACGRACNARCDGCGAPTCLRHARVGPRLLVNCPGCRGT